MGSKSFNVKRIIIFCKHYLNDGTGAPCAGHNNDTMSFSLLTKRLSLASEENLGAAPPMGSMKQSIKTEVTITDVYSNISLDAGIGFEILRVKAFQILKICEIYVVVSILFEATRIH